MKVEMDGRRRHLVLWDGECGFCRRFAGWVDAHDVHKRLQTLPYQQAPEPPMRPELRAACAEALHVFTTEGDVLRGADAVLFVYQQLGYRIAGIGRKPPLQPVLEAGYRVVARNRYLFSRLFFRKERQRR